MIAIKQERFNGVLKAEMYLADRRHFALSAERVAAFEEALDRPVRDKPRLRRLMAERTVLELE